MVRMSDTRTGIVRVGGAVQVEVQRRRHVGSSVDCGSASASTRRPLGIRCSSVALARRPRGSVSAHLEAPPVDAHQPEPRDLPDMRNVDCGARGVLTAVRRHRPNLGRPGAGAAGRGHVCYTKRASRTSTTNCPNGPGTCPASWLCRDRSWRACWVVASRRQCSPVAFCHHNSVWWLTWPNVTAGVRSRRLSQHLR